MKTFLLRTTSFSLFALFTVTAVGAPPPVMNINETAATGAVVNNTFASGDSPFGMRNWPFPAMNDYDDVVSHVMPAENPDGNLGLVAAVWREGQLTELGVAGCSPGVSQCSSRAIAVNNVGVIVGASNAGTAFDPYGAYYEHEFRAVNDTISILRGSEFGWASDVSEKGDITGNARYTDYLVHGYLYGSTAVATIGEYGQASIANALNEVGQVTGAALWNNTMQPFLWQDGQLTNLGTLGGAGGEGFGINESGAIVGGADAANGDRHAFLWQGGTMTDLGTLGGAVSIARAINDAGQVVGYAADANGTEHAFLWQAGVMYDLNDYLPADSGWVLIDAYDINGYGEVLVRGSKAGVESYLILSPPGITKPPRPVASRTVDPVVHNATQVYGGTQDDAAQLTDVDAAGNTFTAGYFYSRSADFDPGTGEDLFSANGYNTYMDNIEATSLFLTKTNADGSYAWTVPIVSNSSWARIKLRDMAVDADGNVIITGSFKNYCYDFDPGPGTSECPSWTAEYAYVAKYDPQGGMLWFGYFRGYTQANGLTVDGAGNIYVTGSFQGQTDFDPGPGQHLEFSPDGGFVKTGYLTKLDPAGTFQWTKIFAPLVSPDTSGATVTPADVAIASTGDIYVSGTFTIGADFDPGTGVAIQTIPNTDGFLVQLKADGSYGWSTVAGTGTYTAGVSADTLGGAYTLFGNRLQQFNAVGTLVWTTNLALNPATVKTDNAWKAYLSTDAAGNIYVPGKFYGSVDFDAGPGYDFLTSTNVDGFITRIRADGAYEWTIRVGGSGYDDAGDIAVDAAGDLFVAGATASVDLDYDAADTIAPVTSHGMKDAFQMKLNIR